MFVGDSSYRYPASYPTVISVAAINRDFKHAKFSNANDQVELSAPGTVRNVLDLDKSCTCYLILCKEYKINIQEK